MVKYFISKTDKNGYVYSIDNCIFEYTLKYPSYKDVFIGFLKVLAKNHQCENEYWDRLDLKPCSKWSWATDVVHLCDGIYLSIGRWNYVKDKNEPVVVPVIKLEINLNKHGLKPIFSDLNDWLLKYCVSCYLIKYDFALDVPVSPDNVEVLKSRKEKGLYKGTRYFGQRNKHGYCKIYDKKNESDIESDLTRIEHTLLYKNVPSLENVYIKSDNISNEKLLDTDKCIIEMLNVLKVYGEDQQKYIDMLGRGKKKQILENINGYTFNQIEYDLNLVYELLEDIRTITKFQDPVKPIFEDANGFIHLQDNEPLPFE